MQHLSNCRKKKPDLNTPEKRLTYINKVKTDASLFAAHMADLEEYEEELNDGPDSTGRGGCRRAINSSTGMEVDNAEEVAVPCRISDRIR